MDQYQFAVDLLKKYEGHNPEWKARWDVNAYRIGYGSDTITFSDGTYRKVKQGDVTNEKNASADLKRRVKSFENKIIKQVGADYWNPLHYKVKGALISLAYNYGSISKKAIRDAIKTGKSKLIANALVESTYNDNARLNERMRNALRKRRKDEADIIRSSPNAKKGFNKKLLLIPFVTYVVIKAFKK